MQYIKCIYDPTPPIAIVNDDIYYNTTLYFSVFTECRLFQRRQNILCIPICIFLVTVNALKYRHGAIFFNYLFWKKLLNKNAINSHFSFLRAYYKGLTLALLAILESGGILEHFTVFW
jgi:hypothetical protein